MYCAARRRTGNTFLHFFQAIFYLSLPARKGQRLAGSGMNVDISEHKPYFAGVDKQITLL